MTKPNDNVVELQAHIQRRADRDADRLDLLRTPGEPPWHYPDPPGEYGRYNVPRVAWRAPK